MTAVDIFRYSDRVVLLTDGAGINSDGSTLGAIAPKMFAMPHLNAVMAVRGVKAIHTVLADYVAPRAATYDELAESLAPKLRDWWTPQVATWEGAVGRGTGSFELFIAGWSGSRGPHAFAIASGNLNSRFGLPAWEAIDVGPCCIAPDDGSLFAKHSEQLLQEFTDPKAIALLEDQRAIRPCTVGGFLQLTTVVPEAISTRVIHRWPDKIGEKIAPGR